MKRPTEHALPGVAHLTDAQAPDFIEAHRVTLLAFVDLNKEPSIRLRGRLNLVAARHARPDDPHALGIGVIDVTESQNVADAVGVREVPAVVVFVGGDVEDRMLGVVPERVLDEVVASRVGAAEDATDA